MKVKLFVLLSFIFFASCENNVGKNDKENLLERNKTELELIQIQFGPSFHPPLMLTFSISDSSILYQRTGFRRNSLIEPPCSDDSDLEAVYKTLSTYFKLDEIEASTILDSILINFSENDYSSKEDLEILDGILTYIVFTFENDSIVEIELRNSNTKKQLQLVTEFLDISEKYMKEEGEKKYLKELKERYY